MCIKCSACGTEFYCKTNAFIHAPLYEIPFPAQECPINFHYVANCRCCWWKSNVHFAHSLWSTRIRLAKQSWLKQICYDIIYNMNVQSIMSDTWRIIYDTSMSNLWCFMGWWWSFDCMVYKMSRGISMRVNRTFSIPVDLVHDLRKKHNQSETVTRALRKYLDDNEEYTLNEASDMNILNELRLRFKPMSPEMELLKTLIAIISWDPYEVVLFVPESLWELWQKDDP